MVIDVGEPKDSMAEDLDALQEQTGIPFVHIDAYLASMDDTYAMLGDLLAMPNEAQGLADYCRYAYDKVKAIADSVEKVNLLYVTGEEGLNVIARGSYHAEVIDMLCNNLAVVDEPSSKGTGNEVDMEQILNWNPDAVIFAPGSITAPWRTTKTGRPSRLSGMAGITRSPWGRTTGWASRPVSSVFWAGSGWPRCSIPTRRIMTCTRRPRRTSSCSITAI